MLKRYLRVRMAHVRLISGPSLAHRTVLKRCGDPLRCGPETSVTSPLRWLWSSWVGTKRYISSRRDRGNPEGIRKERGKGGKPASWPSMLSILCHFHGLLFVRQCWVNGCATPPRNTYR